MVRKLILGLAAALVVAGAAQAEMRTFYFGSDPAWHAQPLVAGSVTYDTAAAWTDGRGPFDLGERRVYGDVTISFDTKFGHRSFTDALVSVWDDYSSCLAYTATECLGPYQAEYDRLMFVAQPIDVSVNLILSGNGQSFLSSAELPDSVLALAPSNRNFTWFESIPSGGLYDVSSMLVLGDSPFPMPSVIPEPPLSLLFGGGLGLAWFLRRKAGAGSRMSPAA